ncbi:MAG TPA: hypothetical protein VF047_03270, partial [Nitrososphaeraceae archaeon]
QANKLAQKRSISILISILYLISLIRWLHNNNYNNNNKTRWRRPYVYSPTVILKQLISHTNNRNLLAI